MPYSLVKMGNTTHLLSFLHEQTFPQRGVPFCAPENKPSVQCYCNQSQGQNLDSHIETGSFQAEWR